MRYTLDISFLESNHGCHIFTSIRIFNKKYKVLIDTGATASVFDVNFVESHVGKKKLVKLNDMAGGVGDSEMAMHVASLSFRLGKKKFEQQVALIDFSHIHAMYELHQLPKFHFIIGNDILVSEKAIINYKTKTLKIG